MALSMQAEALTLEAAWRIVAVASPPRTSRLGTAPSAPSRTTRLARHAAASEASGAAGSR